MPNFPSIQQMQQQLPRFQQMMQQRGITDARSQVMQMIGKGGYSQPQLDFIQSLAQQYGLDLHQE